MQTRWTRHGLPTGLQAKLHAPQTNLKIVYNGNGRREQPVFVLDVECLKWLVDVSHFSRKGGTKMRQALPLVRVQSHPAFVG